MCLRPATEDVYPNDIWTLPIPTPYAYDSAPNGRFDCTRQPNTRQGTLPTHHRISDSACIQRQSSQQVFLQKRITPMFGGRSIHKPNCNVAINTYRNTIIVNRYQKKGRSSQYGKATHSKPRLASNFTGSNRGAQTPSLSRVDRFWPLDDSGKESEGCLI